VDLLKAKDIDEAHLIKLLNERWSNTCLGYPIHEDVRIPSTIAESLKIEMNKTLKRRAGDTKQESQDVLDMLKLSVKVLYKPQIPNEYERLLK